MTIGRLVVCVLLVTAPLAGCLGQESQGNPAGEAGQPTDDPTLATDSLQAPTWSIGDHWTYTSQGFGETTWVVTGDQGGDWIVDTTNLETAFVHAREDISFLGERRKGDLAGSQGDTRVTYFDWPLEENKTWTTTWDGVQREITVDRVDDGVAELTARQEGRVAVEYTYDSRAGHFQGFTFFDENGTETIDAELTASGSGFQGTAVRWDLTTALDLEGTFGVQPVSEGGSFEVPEGATDLWLGLTIRCPSGAYEFGFGGNGSGYNDQDPCPAEADVAEPVVEDPGPGMYSGGLTAASPDGEGSYEIVLYTRTLQEIAVGDG